jgi:CubicO group peptidase (beta-lactamase class C family)
MPTVVSKLTDIQARLDALARQHKVPGASLGVMSGDEVVEFVTGVANNDTGLAVTNDTLFQIGSNTKVFTATLVMQLVDDGKVDLDAPVRKYVPEFKLADARAADRITVRSLLTHTNGIDGADHFPDFGLGDDSLERYVESLAELKQMYPPGEMWSYCNSAFSLAGRLIEKVTGASFRNAFHALLLDPLGLKLTTVRVEDMLVRRCAVGHIRPPGANAPVVTPTPILPVSTAPAGSLTASTPKELLRFVRMHLDGGRSRDGKQILSEASAKAMQQPQAKLPSSSLGEAMGIGWILSNWDGERVIGHGGGTVGQYSFLQVLADRRFGVALFTNGAGGGFLWRDLGRYIFEELADVKMPELPKAPEESPKLDLKRYAGMYRRRDIETEFKVKGGKLVGISRYTGPLKGLDDADEFATRAIDAELFVTLSDDGEGIAHFIDFDTRGRPRYLHFGGRVSKRASDPTTKPRAKPKPKAKAKRKR